MESLLVIRLVVTVPANREIRANSTERGDGVDWPPEAVIPCFEICAVQCQRTSS